MFLSLHVVCPGTLIWPCVVGVSLSKFFSLIPSPLLATRSFGQDTQEAIETIYRTHNDSIIRFLVQRESASNRLSNSQPTGVVDTDEDLGQRSLSTSLLRWAFLARRSPLILADASRLAQSVFRFPNALFRWPRYSWAVVRPYLLGRL